MADLERMGRELKCPICLSLLHSAASLTCNHLFCNSCILKSMKSASSCPVCKIPVTRREVRPAPHMDNLVTIYKSMEASTGISLFATQNSKLTNGEMQCEGNADSSDKGTSGTHENHAEEKNTLEREKSKKKIKTGMKKSTSDSAKPSFPAKKRVQVPQDILSETPLKNLMSGGLLSEINIGTQKASIIEKERPLESEKDDQILSPFFWLREEEDGEKISQPTDEDQLVGSTPVPLSFSDLKDADDENPSNVVPSDVVQDKAFADLFDSEMFEWTQRPCSPELFSSPSKMQVEDTPDIDEDKEELVAASHELETNQSKADAHRTQFDNHIEGNQLANVLQPSVSSPQIRSSEDLNGTKKSRKRSRKARGKADQEQIKEHKDQIDGIDVDSNISLKVAVEQASDYKHKASNLGKSNKRGKRVSFDISKNLTPQTACNVSNRLAVRSNGKTKMAKNSYTSASKQENEKCCPQEIAVQSRERRSGKQKVDCVHDPAENLSSMQNQTNEFPGSASSTLSLQMDNNGNASNSGQRKSNLSRKSESCSRELRRTKKSKPSSGDTSWTKKDEEIQPGERIQQGTDVSALNDTPKEKHCPLTDEPILRKCESHVKKYQCAFCLSSEESEASGGMVHYFNGKPVTADYQGGSKVMHCHRNCTEWAPNVYFEEENAINLEAEISRSRRIKCSFCGLKGAALGCYEKTCRRSFHVPCAKWTSRCRWDMENFVMLCPLHASSILPYEKSGSQQKRKKHIAIEDKSHSQKRETASQSRIAFGSYKKIVLCCSALSVQERDVVSEFERVSKTKVSVLKTWDSSVTHVIASTDENGACRRTLKVLLGILEGKWILSIEWIKACMKETGPVDEEPYEINVDIHGIKDGPRLGRLRALNKQPKLFDGYKFYLMGDFIPSYKGYLQDLVIAAGGTILHRKPVSDDQKATSPDIHSYRTLIIYNLELPDKCNPLEKDAIFTQRRYDAEVLASSTGSKIASNTWILNSIAACKLQSLAQ